MWPARCHAQYRCITKLGIAPAKKASAPATVAEAPANPKSSRKVSWLHTVATAEPAAKRENTRATREWASRARTACHCTFSS